MNEPFGITVLALDPSADVTGIAVVRFLEGEGGHTGRELLLCDSFDATHAEELGTRARHAATAHQRFDSAVQRIRWTRRQIARAAWNTLESKPGEPWCLDVLAYEGHTGRGSGSAVLDGAVFAYLTLSELARFEPVCITRQAACLATGTHGVYRQAAGRTEEQKNAKKARLKGAVLAWALDTYPVFADEARFPAGPRYGACMEGVADALAVAEAAWVSALGAETARRARENAKAAQKTTRLSKTAAVCRESKTAAVTGANSVQTSRN